jgi:hypothetical protein
LTENHRCPRSAVGNRLKQALWAVGIGGTAGVLLTFALIDRPASALVLAFAALGAVLGSAVRQAVSGGR